MFAVTLNVAVPFPIMTNKVYKAIANGFVIMGRSLVNEAFNEARQVTVPGPDGKVYVAWESGRLANSIGSAVSRKGNTNYSNIERIDGRNVRVGSDLQSDKGAISVVVVTTTGKDSDGHGYGRWVEEGALGVPGRFFMHTTAIKGIGMFRSVLFNAIQDDLNRRSITDL